MNITTRLKGRAIATWLGPTGAAVRRAAAEVRARVAGAPPDRLDFYFDPADAWSYLAAQVVARLVARHPVDLAFHAVTPPASDVSPQPALRAAYAVRDAAALASLYDLDFPDRDKVADPGMVRDVAAVLVRDRPARDQLRAAVELGAALWGNDRKRLAALVGAWGAEAHGAVAPALNAGYAALRAAGHFHAGTARHRGQWYDGALRLPLLEAALAGQAPPVRAAATDDGPDAALRLRPLDARGPAPLSKRPLAVELWFSFRSPYSYLALEQIGPLVAAHGVPLVLRPVAPMVERGVPLPAAKRTALLLDARREADRLGVPFGEICDPLGAGVAACVAIAHLAHARGGDAPLAFARSALRGIWAEARDPASYDDLRALVERAGLPWAEAAAAIGAPAAAAWAAANAADLGVLGLWGVPSVRCGDLVLWGQDRLPVLADRLRRHALAAPP